VTCPHRRRRSSGRRTRPRRANWAGEGEQVVPVQPVPKRSRSSMTRSRRGEAVGQRELVVTEAAASPRRRRMMVPSDAATDAPQAAEPTAPPRIAEAGRNPSRRCSSRSPGSLLAARRDLHRAALQGGLHEGPLGRPLLPHRPVQPRDGRRRV
jgi:hypothetical protein